MAISRSDPLGKGVSAAGSPTLTRPVVARWYVPVCWRGDGRGPQVPHANGGHGGAQRHGCRTQMCHYREAAPYRYNFEDQLFFSWF